MRTTAEDYKDPMRTKTNCVYSYRGISLLTCMHTYTCSCTYLPGVTVGVCVSFIILPNMEDSVSLCVSLLSTYNSKAEVGNGSGVCVCVCVCVNGV